MKMFICLNQIWLSFVFFCCYSIFILWFRYVFGLVLFLIWRSLLHFYCENLAWCIWFKRFDSIRCVQLFKFWVVLSRRLWLFWRCFWFWCRLARRHCALQQSSFNSWYCCDSVKPFKRFLVAFLLLHSERVQRWRLHFTTESWERAEKCIGLCLDLLAIAFKCL